MTLNDFSGSDAGSRMAALEQRIDGLTRIMIVLFLVAAVWMCGLTYLAIHHPAAKANAKGNRNAAARNDQRPSKSRPAKQKAQEE